MVKIVEFRDVFINIGIGQRYFFVQFVERVIFLFSILSADFSAVGGNNVFGNYKATAFLRYARIGLPICGTTARDSSSRKGKYATSAQGDKADYPSSLVEGTQTQVL